MAIVNWLKRREVDSSLRSIGSLAYLLGTNVKEESRIRFERLNRPYGIFTFQDADLWGDWLLCGHSTFKVSLYDVSDPIDSRFTVSHTWKYHSYCDRELVYTSVNWLNGDEFYTVTGHDTLCLIDAEEGVNIEEIHIPRAKTIFQHKPQYRGESLIAVASNLSDVPIVDMKTGHIAVKTSAHDSSVRSVSWCPTKENILASSTDFDVHLWDIRMIKYSYSVPLVFTPPGRKRVLPEIQFIPQGRYLIAQTCDSRLVVWDYFCNKSVYFEDIDIFHSQIKYKFAVVPDSSPPLLFVTNGLSIDMINLGTMETINKLDGHLYQATCLLFNSSKNELYSAAKDGVIVWLSNQLHSRSISPY